MCVCVCGGTQKNDRYINFLSFLFFCAPPQVGIDFWHIHSVVPHIRMRKSIHINIYCVSEGGMYHIHTWVHFPSSLTQKWFFLEKIIFIEQKSFMVFFLSFFLFLEILRKLRCHKNKFILAHVYKFINKNVESIEERQ